MTHSPDHHSIENKNTTLRSELKQRRAAQSQTDTSRGALLIRGRLFTWLATNHANLTQAGMPLPRHIAAFYPLPQEPGLLPLLTQWVEEENLSVSLPVVAAPDLPLEFHTWTPDTPMATGPYGIQQPQSSLAPLPDIIIVPTLGFTRQGDRLGYGKGYYDRTLAALRAQGHRFVTLGIAWACGDLTGTAFQPASHDYPLDAILTDKGWAVPAPDLVNHF